jgi:hypothetical protein
MGTQGVAFGLALVMPAWILSSMILPDTKAGTARIIPAVAEQPAEDKNAEDSLHRVQAGRVGQG